MTNIAIEPGDKVRDPLDDQWRTVARIDGRAVYMKDGGVMDLDECTVVRLPSEPIPATALGK